ncbi:MAG: DUF262 domain-containing protein [Armatimonadetes bacterium]|nr:DUF262 domain-containing protein [Armatimonadota bacterium]
MESECNESIVIVELSDEELDMLEKDIVGSGGFQTVLRRLQTHVDRNRNLLYITPELASIITRYSSGQYGSGGFQERLKVIAERMEEAGDYSPDMPETKLEDVVDGEETVIEDNLGGGTENTVLNRYEITSYGADYTLDSLVKRIREDNIFIPPFQRGFVWTHRQASRFIESLLLGLPVPGIFLSKEPESNRLLVIDGQQRLRTLRYFYDCRFLESGKPFALRGVDTRFEKQTYETLSPSDRRHLDDSILHATVIKQEKPSNDESSIYYIFERINTGGTQLAAQEIRKCVYHGRFNELLDELNSNAAWRLVYGRINARMRDQELILRFLALYFCGDDYKAPLKRFLNRYMSSNINLTLQREQVIKDAFEPTIKLAYEAFGQSAFKRVRVLNAAVFDAVMVGLAKRLAAGCISNNIALKEAYDDLMADAAFQEACLFSTSDDANVQYRLKQATAAFVGVQ